MSLAWVNPQVVPCLQVEIQILVGIDPGVFSAVVVDMACSKEVSHDTLDLGVVSDYQKVSLIEEGLVCLPLFLFHTDHLHTVEVLAVPLPMLVWVAEKVCQYPE
jgi:hypothetical protein